MLIPRPLRLLPRLDQIPRLCSGPSPLLQLCLQLLCPPLRFSPLVVLFQQCVEFRYPVRVVLPGFVLLAEPDEVVVARRLFFKVVEELRGLRIEGLGVKIGVGVKDEVAVPDVVLVFVVVVAKRVVRTRRGRSRRSRLREGDESSSVASSHTRIPQLEEQRCAEATHLIGPRSPRCVQHRLSLIVRFFRRIVKPSMRHRRAVLVLLRRILCVLPVLEVVVQRDTCMPPFVSVGP